MSIMNIFEMLGGLALFLFGMNTTSGGLELAAGNKMKNILEKLTSNRILGVAVGALITAIIQSSSATTVMVVGFVNSGLMKLENAVWVIMGANIGTTITGQLVAINITELAPLILFIGVAVKTFTKNQKVDAYGGIVAGIGMIFLGMGMMSAAMVPLRTMPEFVSLITKFQNPVIGIAVGALFTAIIQSSAASVGILQALAISGVITLPSAIYVLFGQNIGTCITSLIASIGTNRNAKRTTALHLSFNVIGTVFFLIVSLMFPFAELIQSITPTNVAAQIANVHTVFNIVTTVLLLPFGKQLVKLTYVILPEKDEQQDELKTKFLDFRIFNNDYHIGTYAMANVQLFKEAQNMLENVTKNVNDSFGLIDQYSESTYEHIMENEEYINYLNKKITEYTTNCISAEFPLEGSETISLFLKVSSDLERIADHAKSVAERAKFLHESNGHFSPDAINDVEIMKTLLDDILTELFVISHNDLQKIVNKVDIIEDSIEKTNQEFAMHQIERLKDKRCSSNHSILFTQTLTDFERIGDHSMSIAKNLSRLQDELSAMKMVKNDFND